MRLCWFIPDDRGGGVASVVLSCVRQARAAGHQAVLLMMHHPSGWMDEVPGLHLVSLGMDSSARNAPRQILGWLEKNPQDVFLQNGGEQADPVIPYVPDSTRYLYVVHDTAPRFWETAVATEVNLDGVVAVSQTVAGKFASRLRDHSKLHVLHNGSFFPALPDLKTPRRNDLIFLGGDNPMKGAHDTLTLWPDLLRNGFEGCLHWFGVLAPQFERRIRALPSSERILRHGRRRRDDIFAAAASSRASLILSRAESFGMATVETMGMGCLPVAWDIDIGTREIITADTGFFAPLGDYDALASQVLQACAEHARLSAGTALRARENFSEEAMWRRYEDLFREINTRPIPRRSHAGQTPPDYAPRRRYFQLLPSPVRRLAREFIGRSARLGYMFRDFRGR